MTGKMKKTIFIAMMAAALGFAACSKAELAQPETDQKGMVLRATVAQSEDTKATFTDNEGVWHFDYAEGDQITVYNKVGDNTSSDYTFTYNGTDFISTDAEPTSEPARWYAFYPSKEVSLVGQTGKWEDLANVYALVGSTPYGSNVTGKDGLDITMDPKCAILKIINQKGSIDINVENKSNGYWIKGLSASGSSFVPSHDEAKQTLLSTTEMGTYYIAVPAGTPITVHDGEKTIKSTSKGLTAGKYYELTIELPFGQGYAEVDASAGIPGNKVKWIQLWDGGPKFAEFNLGATSVTDYGVGCRYVFMGSHPIIENRIGEYYDDAIKLWGSNWRTPTKDELEALDSFVYNYCTNEYTTQDNVNGLLCTGKNAYSSNSLFFPVVEEDGEFGYYWSSNTEDIDYSVDRYCMIITIDDINSNFILTTMYNGFTAHVRAVLAE